MKQKFDIGDEVIDGLGHKGIVLDIDKYSIWTITKLLIQFEDYTMWLCSTLVSHLD